MAKALCVGTLVIDIINDPIDHLLDPGEGILTRIGIHPGGCAFNVAVDTMQLCSGDLTVGCLGAVGEDLLADSFRVQAETHGVVPLYEQFSGVGSSKNVILNVAGEERRHHYDAGANPLLSTKFVSDSIETFRPDLIYLGETSSLDGIRDDVAGIARQAHDSGCLVFLDAVVGGADTFGTLVEACQYADVFHANDVEAMVFTNTESTQDAVRELCRRGVRLPVVTSGGGALSWVHGDQLYTAPAFSVEAVDGTGAGDALIAGLIVSALDHRSGAWLRDENDATSAILFAAAAGARAVTKIGCTAGVMRADALSLVREQGPKITSRIAITRL